MSEAARLCVLFDADTRNNRDLLAVNYNKISSLFEGFADVVAVFEGKGADNLPFERVIELSSTEIFNNTAHQKGDSLIPGNVDLKLLASVECLPEFTHFIRIEFDVWPTDKAVAHIPELCRHATSGAFGASFIRSQSNDSTWMYWPTLQESPGESVSATERMTGFLPLMFFSREFIEHYRTELERGWRGHYEALMPTLARRAGVPLVELGQEGLKLTSYCEFNTVAREYDTPSDGAFIHPVKTLGKRSVTAHTYIDKIHATAAEIDEIARRMRESSCYLEYGSGGTTLLACELGVQSITSIDTDLAFCTQLIEKYSLRSYIDTGRLALRHVNIGKTGNWGYPLSTPPERQIHNYISWPSKIDGIDLILIDGRYRVAVAAAAALAITSNTVIMFHDYFDRPQYGLVEEFLAPVGRVERLAVFRKIEGAEEKARAILRDKFSLAD